MKNKNLDYKNHFKSIKIKKKLKQKLSENFLQIILSLKNDLRDPKKTLNVLNQNFLLNFNILDLAKFKKFKTIAIIGMGGSILGTEAIYNFLKNKIKKKIYFFNDINEYKINNFKKKESLSKSLFIIVSKSGNTTETITNTFSLNIIKKKAKNLILISETKNNFLYNLSKKFNLFYIAHKNNIGGRYSVLSEVGIIPAYLMGINIHKLRSSLLDFFSGINKIFLKESSIILSSLLNSKKYNNLVFLNYSPELEKFLFWCQQLIAESLGKKNKGFFPVISNVPKDHHSLLQLYLDGPKDKIFYIFSTDKKSKIKVKLGKNFDTKHILNNKQLSFIKNAQKNALIKTMLKKNIPFREFQIKKIDEETLGKIFSYFILETIVVANLAKINPYDQPAVEQVKTFTKEILKKKRNQK